MTATAAPVRRSRLDVVTGVMLVVAGAAYGLYAVWLVPVRLWHGLEGLSLLVTGIGTLGFGSLAVWSLRSSRAALLPLLGWFLVTGWLTLFTGPGGDILVPGGLPYDPGVPKVGEFNWLTALVCAAAVIGISVLRRSVPVAGATAALPPARR